MRKKSWFARWIFGWVNIFFKILLENIALKWGANASCKSSNILFNVLPASLEITHVTSESPVRLLSPPPEVLLRPHLYRGPGQTPLSLLRGFQSTDSDPISFFISPLESDANSIMRRVPSSSLSTRCLYHRRGSRNISKGEGG